jgi:hypothetical protein
MNTDGAEILMRRAGLSERTGRRGMGDRSIPGVQLTQVGQQRTGYIMAEQLKSQTTRVLAQDGFVPLGLMGWRVELGCGVGADRQINP